ncbi:MAG: hypothetical protein FJY10_05275 [Bacteroidetes bacterium]|nr:hypothetical protein [Bacteroidota bacterium]
MEQSRLRFGVLCDDLHLFRWQAEALKALMQENTLDLVILNKKIPISQGVIDKIVHYPYRHFLYRVYHRFMLKPKSKEVEDATGWLGKVKSLTVSVNRKGFSEYFDENDVDAIRSMELDFLVRFGFGILRGDILDASKYGIWSFHHDDETKYRGGPPGFWEVYYNDPVNGCILQRLTEKLDAGIPLRRGYFKTVNHSYQANLDQLLEGTKDWLLQVSREVKAGQWAPQPDQEQVNKAKIFKVPGNLRMILFLLKLFCRKLGFHWRELFLCEKWNVGLVTLHDGDNIGETFGKPLNIQWFPHPGRHQYLADPFPVMLGDRLHVICEHFDYRQGRGVIRTYRVDTEQMSLSECQSMEHPLHHSYPFVFVHEGRSYCIPECHLSQGVDIYEVEKDGSLKHCRRILESIAAIDPSLLFFEGYWWLFCTLKGWPHENLHVFYSEDFLGPYKPHHNNPVKTDVRSARPAGQPFIVDGCLYRPAQDCSVTYGGRIALNKVKVLTPDRLLEEVACFIEPDKDSDYPLALHTVSRAGRYIFVDGKRFHFNRYHFMYQLRHKLRMI